jgi:predicted dehydrogenase
MRTIGVGLHGVNGHQVQGLLRRNPRARLVACSAVPRESLPEDLRADPAIGWHDGLDRLLDDPRVNLVSLCSPRRSDQARDAVRCMDRGRHVYAEKPCALEESDLDGILEAARRNGVRFHEMAGTAFEQPWCSMASAIARGAVGEVVQVLAQKSYPFHDRRPGDEAVDGGLLMQVGVHAVRMIEHVAGQRVCDGVAIESGTGVPAAQSGLRMAVSFALALESGGVASVLVNYLNPPGFGSWGNETLRVFGTAGMIEAVDGGTRTRLIAGKRDCGAVETVVCQTEYFERFLNELAGNGEQPLDPEREVHPTRVVIRLKRGARLAH